MSDSVIKSAKRVFEIFEYFDEVQRPVSLKDVAGHFGYPASSASVLLKSLVVMGYLDYDRYSRTYMPTTRIAQLGQWVQGALFGEGSILELMRHLHARTQETICLGTQSDLYAQYVHVLPSIQPFQYRLQPGTVRPLARSGLGWLLLSARSDDVIERLWRRICVEERDPENRIALPDLMARINQVRADGHVYSRHTVTPGAGAIALLLPVSRYGRTFAVCIAGPVSRLDALYPAIVAETRAAIADFFPPEPSPEDGVTGRVSRL